MKRCNCTDPGTCHDPDSHEDNMNAQVIRREDQTVLSGIAHDKIQTQKRRAQTAERIRRAVEERRVMSGRFNGIKGMDKLKG
jgi:hypothetical protein